ncbi:hypothetical protein BV25DRAFT_1902852 [Artomyces pyxidatus]|uniref:Uncharacterized protein n=1 Tax=Artomyces pyxidatus TaxID=48021 RepID=A0ACB8SMT4_9AGAM|nr:hypothetical protein BV25DRAFT_1902852 [Artomyces pyxidatus]
MPSSSSLLLVAFSPLTTTLLASPGSNNSFNVQILSQSSESSRVARGLGSSSRKQLRTLILSQTTWIQEEELTRRSWKWVIRRQWWVDKRVNDGGDFGHDVHSTMLTVCVNQEYSVSVSKSAAQIWVRRDGPANAPSLIRADVYCVIVGASNSGSRGRQASIDFISGLSDYPIPRHRFSTVILSHPRQGPTHHGRVRPRPNLDVNGFPRMGIAMCIWHSALIAASLTSDRTTVESDLLLKAFSEALGSDAARTVERRCPRRVTPALAGKQASYVNVVVVASWLQLTSRGRVLAVAIYKFIDSQTLRHPTHAERRPATGVLVRKRLCPSARLVDLQDLDPGSHPAVVFGGDPCTWPLVYLLNSHGATASMAPPTWMRCSTIPSPDAVRPIKLEAVRYTALLGAVWRHFGHFQLSTSLSLTPPLLVTDLPHIIHPSPPLPPEVVMPVLNINATIESRKEASGKGTSSPIHHIHIYLGLLFLGVVVALFVVAGLLTYMPSMARTLAGPVRSTSGVVSSAEEESSTAGDAVASECRETDNSNASGVVKEVVDLDDGGDVLNVRSLTSSSSSPISPQVAHLHVRQGLLRFDSYSDYGGDTRLVGRQMNWVSAHDNVDDRHNV